MIRNHRIVSRMRCQQDRIHVDPLRRRTTFHDHIKPTANVKEVASTNMLLENGLGRLDTPVPPCGVRANEVFVAEDGMPRKITQRLHGTCHLTPQKVQNIPLQGKCGNSSTEALAIFPLKGTGISLMNE